MTPLAALTSWALFYATAMGLPAPAILEYDFPGAPTYIAQVGRYESGAPIIWVHVEELERPGTNPQEVALHEVCHIALGHHLAVPPDEKAAHREVAACMKRWRGLTRGRRGA